MLRTHTHQNAAERRELETVFLERAAHDLIHAERFIVVARKAPHEQPTTRVGRKVELSLGRGQSDRQNRIAYGYKPSTETTL